MEPIIIDNKGRKPGNGYNIVWCTAYFCKVCKKPIFCEYGVQAPSRRHYYHVKCIENSKTYKSRA